MYKAIYENGTKKAWPFSKVTLLWLGVALLATTLVYFYYYLTGEAKSWYHLSFTRISIALGWALLTPLVYRLYLFSISTGKWKRFLMINSFGALCFSTAHTSISFMLDFSIRSFHGYQILNIGEALYRYRLLLLSREINDFFFYWGIVLILFLYQNFPEKKLDQWMHGTGKAYDRIKFKTNGRFVFLNQGDIQWVKALGNYVQVKTITNAFLVRKTLKSLEQQLNPAEFLRLNRSMIVQINLIKEMEPWFNGEYTVFLKDGTKFHTSKGFRNNLEMLMKLFQTPQVR